MYPRLGWMGLLLVPMMLASSGAARAEAPEARETPSESPAPREAAKGDLPAPRHITTVEGIREYRLGNGLRVLLFPDHSKPTVTVNITYFVGSRHEGYGETGMAHLLEHLLFKGTPTFPDPWKALQDRGARFNGTTWYDRTNYFETLTASDENLEFALTLEADRMINSFIARKDLDSEMTVVRNEFEMGENNPMRVLSQRIMSAAFLWHNYGKSTIGSREDIERVPIDRLQAFYRKYYRPDNAMLVVAGKFDESRALARINDIFGRIPRPDTPLDETYTVEPTQDGEREVILRRTGDVQAVGAVYHIPAASHEDVPAIEVMADILDADQTGRLYKALVETQLATRVRANAMRLFDPGVIEIMAEVRLDKSLTEVRDIMLGVLEGLGGEKITEEEVERAKNRFARNFELMLNDSGRVGIVLTESAASGDWRLMFLYRDRMAKVTPADVQRVASKYLKSSNRTVGMFLPTKTPERSEVPPAPDLAKLMKDYRGKEDVAAGESFEPTPEYIESRTTRSKLSSGTKVALLPKQTRGRRVNVQLTLRFGSEAALAGQVEASDFIAPMLMRGTSKHTRRQIQDELDRLKAQVQTGGGGRGLGSAMSSATAGEITLSIETIRKHLPAVLDLAAEMLRDSTFPDREFTKLQREALSQLEQQLSDPMALAANTLQRRLNPFSKGNIRYVPTLEEKLSTLRAVKNEEVRRLYSELLGAGSAELAIVGDFDPSEISTHLDNLLRGWESKKAYERITRLYQPVDPDKVVINTPDKANAFFAAGMNLAIRDDDPDYPALFMANYLLGGGGGHSRLMKRIRHTEGLSYGVFSVLRADSLDRTASFFAGGICAPENAERALTCVFEEVEKLREKGVTLEELDDAKRGYLEQLKVTLSNDGAVAGIMTNHLFLGRTMEFTKKRNEQIKALTPEDILAAVRKYIEPEKFVVVRAGDFEPSSPEASASE